MRIAIVGGGICGLSTYLNLKRHLCEIAGLQDSIDVTIFESHASKHEVRSRNGLVPSFGGGYGLAPNGMASLRRLNPDIHRQILENGFVSPKTTLKSARGWILGTLPFVETRGGYVEACVMVLRQVVLDALYQRIPKSAVIRRKVVKVEDGDSSATLTLEDNEQLAFDLVIGADGIWSRARKAVLGDQCSNYGPIYKGLFTVGGFVSSDCLPAAPETGIAAHSQTVMTFGPNGFFGYTPYDTLVNVKITEDHIEGKTTLPAGQGAFWWSRSAQKDPTANPDDAAVKAELRKTHKLWNDTTIHRLIDASEQLLKQPTYVLPKLPRWAGTRVILAGDAAHALPSSSGQGVSQAIEDGEALALLLAHNLQSEGLGLDAQLERTIEQYTTVRKAHVERVLDAGNRAGDTSRDMSPGAEIAMYTGFWLMLKLFGAFFLKSIRDYDVVTEVEKITKPQ